MELNEEQIKMALECCVKAETHLDCRKLKCPALINDECIYIGETDEDCDRQQLADALSLINSQEQRIKELEAENEKLTINMNAYGLTAKRLGEENERLREDNNQLTEMWEENQRQWQNLYRKLKIENEMLLTHIPIPKEMLEGE